VVWAILSEVSADDKRKLARLGVWWTFRGLNVVEVRVGVRKEDVDVELLVMDAVWKEIVPRP
jgi:hypothetical protein